MEFITDNYIWFIVGGVVIVMAIIGYFADKTDFGRKKDKEEKPKPVKKEKPKKEKKEKPQPKNEKIEVEVKGIGDLSQSITEQMKETLPIESQPIEANTQDLYAGIGDVNPSVEDNTVVDDSLFAPLTDSSIAKVEETAIPEATQPVDNALPIEEPVSEPIDVETELQNIEPTPLVDPIAEEKQNNEAVAEDDDIWKF